MSSWTSRRICGRERWTALGFEFASVAIQFAVPVFDKSNRTDGTFSRADFAFDADFAPSNWRDLDRRDLDLGGTAAIPFDVVGPNGARKLIFAIGKTGEAYLLDRDNLGGVGGALANARVTTNVAITSPRRLGAPLTGYLSFCRAMARIVREVSRRMV